MFTGLIQNVAKVRAVQHRGSSSVIELELGALASEVKVGDSVAIDGACLTAVAVTGGSVSFDVSAETLRKTTLGDLRRGSEVNVELAMKPTDRFGGHFVSGHVDGTGVIAEKANRPGEVRLKVRTPRELTDMMVVKGSVAVDGISLTVAALSDGMFEVSLIPHTLAATTLKDKGAGARVNIECDMVGKWVQRLVKPKGGLTIEKLREEGY
jgi:riboflavin synthase